ncbi:MAG: helix-turn-helix transcriptional regulator [Lentisphaeria bacterium]|nr:helix-turn-helix transcriptional regulator [Lentisphaeria bacterium]
MSIENKDHFLHLSNRLHLQITHFAYGIYPAADGTFSSLPVNRLLFCLGSTDNEESYVADAEHHFSMQSGHFYFIPANHVAGVRLSAGMYFVSIQFLLDLYNGLDVFASVKKILDFEGAAQVEQARKIFDIAAENIWLAKLPGLTYDCIGSVFEKLEPIQLNLTEIAEFSVQSLRLISGTCTAMTTVAELADLCNVNRDTFSRNFTRKNGITPKQFLTRCILRRAYILLSSGKYRVHEVAKELKFSNEFYFSRFFKKHTGVTPKDFRMLHYSNF